MDDRHFDDLARSLARGTSRRRAIRSLIGAAAGAVGLAGGREAAAQTCRPAGRLCTKNANCCSAICDTTNADPSLRNRCACPEGTVNCRGLCCPTVANGTPTCDGGQCGIACDPGFVLQEGSCVPSGECVVDQDCVASCPQGGCCFDIGEGGCFGFCPEDLVCCISGLFCFSIGCEQGSCTSSEIVAVEQPQAVVWQALTDSGSLAAWLMENDFEPQVGRRFRFQAPSIPGFDGVVTGEVLEVEAPRRITYSWQVAKMRSPSRLTIELEPTANGTGTLVRIAHTGRDKFRAYAVSLILGRTWKQDLLRGTLPRHLARMSADGITAFSEGRSESAIVDQG